MSSNLNTQNIKTEWDLSLIYDSLEDPQIKKDVQRLDQMYTDFADEYKDREDYLEDSEALKKALERLEEMKKELNSSKPARYCQYHLSLDSNNQKAESLKNKLSQKLTKISNKTLFFSLKLGRISEEQQDEFLQSEELSHFHYYLERLFKESQYDLSEEQEEVLNLTNLPRYGMWVDGVNKSLNKHTIEFEGKSIPLPEAANKVHDLPEDKRRGLHEKLMNEIKDVSDFAESEINAVVTNKKIIDNMRGYDEPYSATIFGYENKEDVVLNLVDTVTDHFDISHSFYTLKSDLLGIDPLRYEDREANIGDISKEIDFEDAADILHSTFSEVDKAFADILERFLKNGQIDAYPKEGKTGGAFCSGSVNLPTYVLLNHTPSFGSVTTFAHEMGHAIHTELSKSQSPIYQGYSTAVAEVASTFFERVVFDAVFENLDENEQAIALHDRINQDIATVFRQIALFNFEVELHKTIREEGSMSQEEIAELMNTHMKEYLGDIFELRESDGYYFINWPHIRYFFYVYTYAYGNLISRAMYARYKEDNEYIEKVKQFLSAGSFKAPHDIFADIGIDTEAGAVFKKGLNSISQDIEKLKQLTS